jgi:GGDEF domain-containing protein
MGVTFSVGIVDLRRDESPGEFLKRADTAMYRTKHESQGAVSTEPSFDSASAFNIVPANGQSSFQNSQYY